MKRKNLSPIPLHISTPRRLAIRWVFCIEFDIDPDTIHPTAYSRLLEKLDEEAKNPMEWTEQECQQFVVDLVQSKPETGFQKLVERYAPTLPLKRFYFINTNKQLSNE